MNKNFDGYPLKDYNEIKSYFSSFGDYLYVEQNDETMMFYPTQGEKIPSHYIRTIIAQYLGKPERANWEIYANQKDLTYAQKNLLGPFKHIFPQTSMFNREYKSLS
ncbi:MAG: hypothetical protein AAF380_00600 [Bacteroidota bacterium]